MTQPESTRHPKGLYTLFFTEMWERASYYGMRALLVLFMVDSIRGGMGLNDKTATAIYGLYTGAAYLASLPGGWVADRLLGAQRAVWIGGWIIALGHFTLAIPSTETFFLGLILVVSGTGLLKPNISAMVGDLYPEGGARRDAGFTIFYMGINFGAFAGPLVCSALGEKVNWHLGFGAAGIGMVLGLIQFRLTRHLLGNAGLKSPADKPLPTAQKAVLGGLVSLALLVLALSFAGIIVVNPIALAKASSTIIALVALSYFAWALLFARLEPIERKRVGMIAICFVASAVFWAGFEQAGSSLNLFTERYTDRAVGSFVIPTGWFQSLGPFFVITLAPLMANLWLILARRHLDPSIPAKFGWAMVLLGLGFFVMMWAAQAAVAHGQVGPTWLITTYLLHTFGELCLSPVGLSSVTKLAPRRLVGQMMGIWFLGSSLGNLLAGLVAGQFETDSVANMPGAFLRSALWPIAAGIVLFLIARPTRKWTEGIK